MFVSFFFFFFFLSLTCFPVNKNFISGSHVILQGMENILHLKYFTLTSSGHISQLKPWFTLKWDTSIMSHVCTPVYALEMPGNYSTLQPLLVMTI